VEEAFCGITTEGRSAPPCYVLKALAVQEERGSQPAAANAALGHDPARRIHCVSEPHQRVIAAGRGLPPAVVCLREAIGWNLDDHVHVREVQSTLTRPPQPKLELAILVSGITRRKTADV